MARSFRQMEEALKAAKARRVLAVGAAVGMMQQEVSDKTPRDTGRAQSNWFAEINGCSGKTTDDTSRNNLSAFQSLLEQAEPDKVRYFVLFNNLPYIRHLEYGLYPNPPKGGSGKTAGGFSTQAPQGMLRISARRFKQLIKQAGGRL